MALLSGLLSSTVRFEVRNDEPMIDFNDKKHPPLPSWPLALLNPSRKSRLGVEFFLVVSGTPLTVSKSLLEHFEPASVLASFASSFVVLETFSVWLSCIFASSCVDSSVNPPTTEGPLKLASLDLDREETECRFEEE